MAAVTALKHFRILQTRGLIQQCIKCKSTTTSSPTHYDTLGVSRSATAAEIKNAYIKKTKVLHPDKSKNGDNEELYKVQEAYNILSKEKDKKEYDSMIFAVEDYHRYRIYEVEPNPFRSSAELHMHGLLAILLLGVIFPVMSYYAFREVGVGPLMEAQLRGVIPPQDTNKK